MFTDTYLWLKALHIIAIVAWMAGLLYLPRLYVYHSQVAAGSEASELFKVMERRLLRGIMNPAMIAVWLLGFALAIQIHAFDPHNGAWLHAKLALVLLLSGIHGMLAKYRKDFAQDRNYKSTRYFRILNEVPAVALVLIVWLVVLKPF